MRRDGASSTPTSRCSVPKSSCARARAGRRRRRRGSGRPGSCRPRRSSPTPTSPPAPSSASPPRRVLARLSEPSPSKPPLFRVYRPRLGRAGVPAGPLRAVPRLGPKKPGSGGRGLETGPGDGAWGRGSRVPRHAAAVRGGGSGGGRARDPEPARGGGGGASTPARGEECRGRTE